MSVSSHLNPEPERRLWLLHAKMRAVAALADIKLAGLAAFCLMELALLMNCEAAPLSVGAAILLALELPLCVFAVSPFMETPGRISLVDHNEKPAEADSLLVAHDLAKYPRMELIIILDRYLGGGITATPYYEDIVGRIVTAARSAARKERLLSVALSAALAAQLFLAAMLIRALS